MDYYGKLLGKLLWEITGEVNGKLLRTVTGGRATFGSPDAIFLFFSTNVHRRSGAKLLLPLPRAEEILSDFMVTVGSHRGQPIFAREAKTTLDITLQN